MFRLLISAVLCVISISSLHGQAGAQIKPKKPVAKPTEKENEKEKEQKKQAEKKAEKKLPMGNTEPLLKKGIINVFIHYSYFTLGGLTNNSNQLGDLFQGKEVTTYAKGFGDTFSMTTASSQNPTPLNSNFGYGLAWGFDLKGSEPISIEMSIITMGLLPWTTLDESTTMTLVENCKTTICHLENSGFVDSTTKKGEYSFSAAVSEELVITSPMFGVNYALTNLGTGELQVGIAAGAIFASHRQQIQFSSVRSDDSSSTVAKALEGRIQRTSVGDFGPIAALHLAYDFPLFAAMGGRVKLGFHYGFVDLQQTTTGTLNSIIGGTEVSVSPISELGFAPESTVRLELMGAFLQAGIVF